MMNYLFTLSTLDRASYNPSSAIPHLRNGQSLKVYNEYHKCVAWITVVDNKFLRSSTFNDDLNYITLSANPSDLEIAYAIGLLCGRLS